MHFITSLPTLLATTSAVSAVTIRNFRTGTCKGNYLQCGSVPQLTCCDESATRVYSSSLFLGLPATAIGSICIRTNNKNCGTVKKSGHGLSLCLGNAHFPPANSRGSFWFNCMSRCSRSMFRRDSSDMSALTAASSQSVAGEAKPDIVAFEGQQFNIGRSTPVNASEALMEMFFQDASYADISAEYMQYELATAIGDEE